MSPVRAILLHSPGRKPWVIIVNIFIEPQKGRHSSTANIYAESAAPTELDLLLSVFTQGFISGFALITPWALQECRAYGTRNLTEFLMRVFSTRKCNTGFANLDRKLYAVALKLLCWVYLILLVYLP